jgi:hypothetical protein
MEYYAKSFTISGNQNLSSPHYASSNKKRDWDK